MRMKDRVALITGASRGVGAACAVALAREGCSIVAAAKTLEPHPKLPGTLHDTVAAVEAVGSRAIAVQVDVRFEEQVEAMVDEAMRVFGRIDYLVNNAGAIFWSPVDAWPVKKFDLVMGVNVRASFLCSRAVLPIMKEQGFGHILMMSPPEVPKAAPGKGPYLVSKLGMTMLARAIDDENKASGICSTALWPVTGIRTAATENLGMGEIGEWRTPEILADATVELLAKDPANTRFHAWLDEDVLAESGITDLIPYRCDPEVEPHPMSILLVDPDWTRER
ncbi:MAG TPA: SDR family oxidoreductase [Deltaproteobacteria bacterium]|nr:SDR family oxidoreductase [Deltaproteobacteria bacterium]HCP44835.1 SDR family oxidoreductase [Deltaproteobacteria bacterium]